MIERTPISFGTLERIFCPKDYLKENVADFKETVKLVRSAFGSNMTEQDVYDHLVMPEQIFFIRKEDRIIGMFAYTSKVIVAEEMLFVDGVALDPSAQGKGLFEEVTSSVVDNRPYIGLKTQNPRMYRALEKVCSRVYPNIQLSFPSEIDIRMNCLAEALGVKTDEKKVVRAAYGKSLYSSVPTHRMVSPLFDDVLKVNYEAGDSVLCLGLRR